MEFFYEGRVFVAILLALNILNGSFVCRAEVKLNKRLKGGDGHRAGPKHPVFWTETAKVIYFFSAMFVFGLSVNLAIIWLACFCSSSIGFIAYAIQRDVIHPSRCMNFLDCVVCRRKPELSGITTQQMTPALSAIEE